MVMPSILDLSDPPSAPPCGAFRPPPARSARALPTRCQVLDHLGDVLAERGPRILLVQGLACQHRRIRGGPIIAEDEVGGESDEPVEGLPDPHHGGMTERPCATHRDLQAKSLTLRICPHLAQSLPSS